MKKRFYDRWAHLNGALSQGERFDVRRVDSDVNCNSTQCTMYEMIRIDMSLDKFRKLSEREVLSFKITGSKQSTVLEIPQSYMTGFLSAIDER